VYPVTSCWAETLYWRIPMGMRLVILSSILTIAFLLPSHSGAVGGDATVSGAPEGFQYPPPTGPFRVGADYLLLEDSARLDTYSDAPDDHRWISLRLWYPASPDPGATPDAYGYADFDRWMVESGYFDPKYIADVGERPSASFRNAPPDPRDAPWPIVIYSPSAFMNNNIFLCEELASHGYFVVTIGHPYWCEFYLDGEGKLFHFDKSNAYYTAMWDEEGSLPVIETKEGITRATDGSDKLKLYRKLNEIMPTEVADLDHWHEDIDFLIDQLIEMNRGDGPYADKLDTDRIGIIGYSKGGALAGQICATSDRVRAGINLDGFMFGGVVDSDLAKPFMIFGQIISWCQDCPSINLPFFQRARSDAYLVEIWDANHSTFTDLPLLREYIVPDDMLTSLDGERSALIIESYVLAFFDAYVRGHPKSSILEEVPSRFDEVRYRASVSGHGRP
jgi:hypothetical protein